MIKLQTDLEGKTAYFGPMKEAFRNFGFDMGGNWDYHKGSFDCNLWRDAGETIYIRAPFIVLDGMLDHPDTHIQFQAPYVIKHVVNIGLDKDEQSLITAVGLNQFQDVVDSDGNIENKNKWVDAGDLTIKRVLEYIYTH